MPQRGVTLKPSRGNYVSKAQITYCSFPAEGHICRNPLKPPSQKVPFDLWGLCDPYILCCIFFLKQDQLFINCEKGSQRNEYIVESPRQFLILYKTFDISSLYFVAVPLHKARHFINLI